MNRGGGFDSFGRGGGGRGRRNWFQATGLTGWQRAAGASTAPASPDAARPGQEGELAGLLKSLAERFERALASIDKRIEGLEAKTKPE